ncbi:MAG TPA: DUF3237 domain-containing protein [Ilumatobacter sp.]|nr:DUF3237 domain-containing protein [Ilumatobacter sp.]
MLAPLLTIRVDVGPLVSLGDTPVGERRMIPFAGGTFSSDRGEPITGTVAPGGVDWQLVRSDGGLEIDAHYLLFTDREESIEVRSTGLRVASPEVLAKLAAGTSVDPSEYYFRTHIRLSTSSERLDHLNRTLAVSFGEREQHQVVIRVFELL